MISGIDHVVIAVRDLDRGVRAYEGLLGGAVSTRTERDGAATAVLVTNNVAVEVMAPVGEGDAATRLRAAIEDGGEGLKSLVFATRDIVSAHRRAARVGLGPAEIAEHEGWRSFRLSTERTHGVRMFMLERAAPLHAPAASESSLDHVVVRSSDMERAAALYGARLGFSMRLDRDVMGRRLMFFRVGAFIVEIAEDKAAGPHDRLWGLSWRVKDADLERTRLGKAGFDVSAVRAGAKPGTRVFTVRNGTCEVPTLMIEAGLARD